jgi:hypothetical protein
VDVELHRPQNFDRRLLGSSLYISFRQATWLSRRHSCHRLGWDLVDPSLQLLQLGEN